MDQYDTLRDERDALKAELEQVRREKEYFAEELRKAANGRLDAQQKVEAAEKQVAELRVELHDTNVAWLKELHNAHELRAALEELLDESDPQFGGYTPGQTKARAALAPASAHRLCGDCNEPLKPNEPVTCASCDKEAEDNAASENGT
jgi:hypothetical protein